MMPNHLNQSKCYLIFQILSNAAKRRAAKSGHDQQNLLFEFFLYVDLFQFFLIQIKLEQPSDAIFSFVNAGVSIFSLKCRLQHVTEEAKPETEGEDPHPNVQLTGRRHGLNRFYRLRKMPPGSCNQSVDSLGSSTQFQVLFNNHLAERKTKIQLKALSLF